MLAVLALYFATVHPQIWPARKAPPPDPKIEKAVEQLVRSMTVEEKVGQVIQPSIIKITPAEVRQYHIGSVLNGGGGWPGDVRKAKPSDWLSLADALYDASMQDRLAIPVIWGADAVHGHNNIVGATLFPHNIGLGATRDPELLRRIGEVTADEMAVTGIDWDFSPTVAVVQDPRWGRTYESYSQDPSIVRMCAKNMVAGLQSSGRVFATAKHFLGDGGTAGGKDQGDNLGSERELRDIHLAGYLGALESGVQSIMVSYSSWHGEKMHGNRALLTDVLKDRLHFDGIVVGDWNGHAQVPGCSNGDCPHSFNAGLDVFMVPEDWKALYEHTLAEVNSGVIPKVRLDDAVRRILRVKMRRGLFTAGKPSSRPHGGRFEEIGSPAHREVARRAVRESLVLLKNEHATLPLRAKRNVLVAGDGADDIPRQTGGWTLTWQGDGNSNADFPGATSIWAGIRNAVDAAGGKATLAADGAYSDKPDVAIVVFGEDPYAEFRGDRDDLVYDQPRDLALVERLHDAGVPVVSVFLSGRPLSVNRYLNASDAFVAAWLPGTEGEGVADVLFGKNDFQGKLSFAWPPRFPLGYGLRNADRVAVPQLAPEPVKKAAAGWKIEPAADGTVITPPMSDLSREANGDLAIEIEAAPANVTGPVMLTAGSKSIDVTSQVVTGRIRVPLKAFGEVSRLDAFHINIGGVTAVRFVAP